MDTFYAVISKCNSNYKSSKCGGNHKISICETDSNKRDKKDDNKYDQAVEVTSSNCFSDSFQVLVTV